MIAFSVFDVMNDGTPTFSDRLLEAHWGALLGGLVVIGTFVWTGDAIPWHLVGAVAAAAAVFSFVLGRQFIRWLKIALSTVWW